jgi:Flp pilus assembly pilin Flp
MLRNRVRGASVLEYGIIFGIVAIVLFAMTTYAKRAFQGEVKDLTDNFISSGLEEQASDTYVRAQGSSNSSSNAASGMIITDALGGARSLRVNETSESKSSSIVIDYKGLVDASVSGGDGISFPNVTRCSSANSRTELDSLSGYNAETNTQYNKEYYYNTHGNSQ